MSKGESEALSEHGQQPYPRALLSYRKANPTGVVDGIDNGNGLWGANLTSFPGCVILSPVT